MADSIKESTTLSIIAEFTDGDDRTITVPNPKSNITWAQIEALNASASNVLLGDRNAANFYRMKEAFTRNTRTIHFDLKTE